MPSAAARLRAGGGGLDQAQLRAHTRSITRGCDSYSCLPVALAAKRDTRLAGARRSVDLAGDFDLRLPGPRGDDAHAARGRRGDGAVPARHVRQPERWARGGPGGQDGARGGPGRGRRAPRGPPGRGGVHRRRHRGRQPGGEGWCPPRPRHRASATASSPPRSSTRGCWRRAIAWRPRAFRVATVALPSTGVVDVDALVAEVDDRTVLVSVMLVNNEVGTIQPLDEIVARVREHAPRALVHTDAVQAVPWLDVARATAARRPGGDLGAQVRRPEGHRRARGPRRRRARAADRRRRAGRWRALRHVERRGRGRDGGGAAGDARRRATPTWRGSHACAHGWSTVSAPPSPTRSRTAIRRPRSRATRTSASAGSRPRRCWSRSTRRECARPRARRARRVPPTRRTCSRRWASARDDALSSIRLSLGYASTDADVDVALDVVPTAVVALRHAGAAA